MQERYTVIIRKSDCAIPPLKVAPQGYRILPGRTDPLLHSLVGRLFLALEDTGWTIRGWSSVPAVTHGVRNYLQGNGGNGAVRCTLDTRNRDVEVSASGPPFYTADNASQIHTLLALLHPNGED